MLVTPAGMVRGPVKPEQYAKAEAAMLVTPAGIVRGPVTP
jgi:hypothetical protein